MLDAIGARYSKRPSELLGIPADVGLSIVIDSAVIVVVMEHMEESKTVGGQIRADKSKWPKEIKQELKEMNLWK